jgi:hypothetical protein
VTKIGAGHVEDVLGLSDDPVGSEILLMGFFAVIVLCLTAAGP